jgi:hypothetical protein
MAYNFTGASSQYLSATNPVSAAPFTISAWSRIPDLNSNKTIVSLNSSTKNIFQFYIAGNTVSFYIEDSTPGFTQPQAPLAVVANTWFHVAAVEASATSHKAVLNGTSSQTTTTSETPTGINGVTIGVGFYDGSFSSYMTGQIAEVGIWSAALTDAEIVSLAKGMTCNLVRPQSLVFYAPLIRNLQDVKGGLTLTNNNTATVFNHPRVYR